MVNGKLPRCFDRKVMEEEGLTLEMWQIAHWDEVHKTCTVGDSVSQVRTIQILFPRDINGNVDVKHGKYSENYATKINVKYAQEARICIGLGLTDKEEGVRLQTFSYTGKTLKTIKDMNTLRKSVIEAAKNSPKVSDWVENTRDKGKFYIDDDVGMISGVGPKKRDLLAKIGIKVSFYCIV